MENLIAAFRILTEKGGIRYGSCYIKQETEASVKARAAIEPNEAIDALWVSKWKEHPSHYKLIFGKNAFDVRGPNYDVANDLRVRHLKVKDTTKVARLTRRQSTRDAILEELTKRTAPEPGASSGRKPHIKLVTSTPWHPFVPEEAKANA